MLLNRVERGSGADKKLLTVHAVEQIERTEKEYVRSIQGLFQLTESRIQQPGSPLLVSYREKPMLIDSAIAECRSNIARNRLNAHLRMQLLSIYQDKERTLREILEEEK